MALKKSYSSDYQLVRGVIPLDAAVGGESRRTGWGNYSDGTGAVALTAATWAAIPNDNLGGFGVETYLPAGVTRLLDTTTGALDASDLLFGDILLVRNDFSITTEVSGAIVEFRYTAGGGPGAYTIERQLGPISQGTERSYRFFFTDIIYLTDANTKDNHIGLEIKLSENGTITNSGSVVTVLRGS